MPRVALWALLLAAPAWASTLPRPEAPGRQTISLDGVWEIGEGNDAQRPPPRFDHKGPVPGLVHSASPGFAAVDQYESRAYVANLVANGLRPKTALAASGVSRQPRSYFWYRTHFVAPATRARAFLKIDKAQFGSELWVNGRDIGGSIGCAASTTYDITAVLRWAARNDVQVRIGADPGVLPDGAPCGTDMEKSRWTPGIYDSVAVYLTGAVQIKTTQVAPRLTPRAIIVESALRNTGTTATAISLSFSVHPWKSPAIIAVATVPISLKAGETRTVTTAIAVPGAALWSPETPNLYALESRVAGDSVTTRFGMREFRFDTVSGRAYLNGQPYFLRGSNIALHRFFEDPLSERMPWNHGWVAMLLGDRARSMHWNAMRFTIGPVPDFWLDIADEQGLIIQQEFPIWNSKMTADQNPRFDTAELIHEFAGWMRDGWNHPSVAIWDASNETSLPQLAAAVIPAVRPLDLSDRAWENSYNAPLGADDPVEDHPYEYVSNEYPELGAPFDMTLLETRGGAERAARTVPTGHAMLLNEYGWLWLNRDGSPTQLTTKIYSELPYPRATADDRRKTHAYLLAGLTEYWRAYRRYAGVMHFVYLTGEVAGGFTSDSFVAVKTLQLDPFFQDYVGEAFRPLGVYINFWTRELAVGDHRDYQIMMVNDMSSPVRGQARLSVANSAGRIFAATAADFEIAANGQTTMMLPLTMPRVPGDYMLTASATPATGATSAATLSRRWLRIQ